ncbi:hypothetical protein VSR17_00035 [Cupriavidus taiwanensis]|uniref:Uncharacterized protein n=1 Tax=Cupriavidus taiwanensis TaxID=164546 RepID=A0A375I9A5_9BURK|nr:hypothetical protein [Cupriavidus taiwanensis]SOY54108.1 hypothetical protein CBM2588_A40043 [Cupriavidus taiwanensis]SOY54915.1 hypothetical protein CBM2592_A60040 [Cupriavidus taiwanensis]SOY88005.1 hypothetical protein CBM2591_A50039 [Cupriavidus taiwanensis]SOZ24664.1 hypothetical protein CBM2608_A50008 [Cupriavidus taiwanensis]SOZ61278.1 hypothetical protein CBM2617_A40040 [Cupriavidus taiwanensis]
MPASLNPIAGARPRPRHTVPPVEEPAPPGVPPDLPLSPEDDPPPPPVEPPVAGAGGRYCFSS